MDIATPAERHGSQLRSDSRAQCKNTEGGFTAQPHDAVCRSTGHWARPCCAIKTARVFIQLRAGDVLAGFTSVRTALLWSCQTPLTAHWGAGGALRADKREVAAGDLSPAHPIADFTTLFARSAFFWHQCEQAARASCGTIWEIASPN